MVPMNNREVTGSLFERNGRYTAVLNLYDKNGKRRQKSVALGIPVKGNKRKAQARLEELKKEYSSGIMEPEPPQEPAGRWQTGSRTGIRRSASSCASSLCK